MYLGDLTPIGLVPYAAQNDITSLGPSNYQQPLTKPFFVTPPKTIFEPREVRVAFDGTNYLVVWCESHYKLGDWLMGCRISPQGTVLDPGGFRGSSSTRRRSTPI